MTVGPEGKKQAKTALMLSRADRPRFISLIFTGKPGYEGVLNDRVAALPEILKDLGGCEAAILPLVPRFERVRLTRYFHPA